MSIKVERQLHDMRILGGMRIVGVRSAEQSVGITKSPVKKQGIQHAKIYIIFILTVKYLISNHRVRTVSAVLCNCKCTKRSIIRNIIHS